MFAEWICLQRHIILHTQPMFVCNQFRGGAKIIGIRFKRFPRADWCVFQCWWKTRKLHFTVQADWPPWCRQDWHTDHLSKLETERFIGRDEDRARHCGRWGMNHTWEQPCKEICSISWCIVRIWYLIWFGWWKTVIKNKHHSPLPLFIWLSVSANVCTRPRLAYCFKWSRPSVKPRVGRVNTSACCPAQAVAEYMAYCVSRMDWECQNTWQIVLTLHLLAVVVEKEFEVLMVRVLLQPLPHAPPLFRSALMTTWGKEVLLTPSSPTCLVKMKFIRAS